MKILTSMLIMMMALNLNGQSFDNPEQLKRIKKLADSSNTGGGCINMEYKIYTHPVYGYEYCFFKSRKKLKINVADINNDLEGFAEVIRYFPTMDCLVIKLYDPSKRRSLQGYITDKFCWHLKPIP